MKLPEKTMGILNLKAEEIELSEEEADMIELVASVLDESTYNLLNDLLHEIKKEVDADNVLDEIELRYESLGLTVRFMGDRTGKEAVLPKQKKKSFKRELDYYV